MRLIFVHGWSVTDTRTYGELPQAVTAAGKKEGLEIDVTHVHLGRYISFHDEVRVSDIAKALDVALREQIPNNADGRQPFSCITHSTGAPVVRTWVNMFYGSGGLTDLPLRHLIMLAPANHGSPLAQIGKARLGRVKAFFQGIEPGAGVLDWLEIGSEDQLALNTANVAYRPVKKDFYPVVLTGQSIYEKLYDHLNSYTDEPGSDGVVRIAGANMNYRVVRLVQTGNIVRARSPKASELRIDGKIRKAPAAPLGIVPNASHTGEKLGIMGSVTMRDSARKPVVEMIVRTLAVSDEDGYNDLQRVYDDIVGDSVTSRQDRENSRYSQVIWRVSDSSGRPVRDFDLLLLGGPRYDPDQLPKGFYLDRQRNRRTPETLTYYLDHARMLTVEGGKIGFRVVARPQSGFAHYRPAEFRSEDLPLNALLRPHETLIVDIVLLRYVDKNTFRLGRMTKEVQHFKRLKPSGDVATID